MMLPKSSGAWLESQGVVGKFSLVVMPSWKPPPHLGIVCIGSALLGSPILPCLLKFLGQSN